MTTPTTKLAALAVLAGLTAGCARFMAKEEKPKAEPGKAYAKQASEYAGQLLAAGRDAFRYDTFGSEAMWGDALQLHKALLGLSPKKALELGLKVDSERLPKDLAKAFQKKSAALDKPETTAALLAAHAVVGVRGVYDDKKSLKTVGITCALCHSTVDSTVAPGVGRRLDGWPNRDLNVGAIAASAPNFKALAEFLDADEAELKKVLAAWGPGRYDAVFNMDGKGFRPDGKTAATLVPAAFGLAGVNLATYSGWGGVGHWNAYVASTQMYGQGAFYDPRLNDPAKYPLAAKSGLWNKRAKPDRVTPKLPALHYYQLSLPAPKAPAGSFDPKGAERGRALFAGKAECARCHVPPLFTEPGYNMHAAKELGIDDFQSSRSPEKRYRTTPLRGLFTRAKGGYYHDGRFAALPDVVKHYDKTLGLGLNDEETKDLVEFLKSL